MNYGYKLIILLILRQVKKISLEGKKRVKKLIDLYKNFYKIVKLGQKYIKKYYNCKKIKGLNLKEGNKV